ncbi:MULTISPECIES: alpha/beta fold hydrolase [Streptomyces]|uniref:Alpha/beta hydrolase fold protein n=1 Tax=Streptomyces albus (strain ATCC 21838 / DSM 41398 / FERM P-419 / JCM 4703 / NBRC 107858) TaxID=1081613 RepID=A0A0B5F298_STRA4|nr:alpha/beta fold hydrolase [Streptomyces sp. SCSIO ZS0520]AJE85006.1 alpha/beta hydrolase fold protein [Streptomyces albus]AOU79312.1 alpha/beta hydrolase fold protein [Streptomyces albus]AYN35040.1 alpha/beta hydrolase fold protein [Streptomyces albus]
MNGVRHELLGEAHLTLPEGTPKAVIVLNPAMGVPATYYARFSAQLAGHGIAVVAAELRGQGASRPRSGRRTRHGYQQLIAHDVPETVAAVRAHFGPELPLYLLGHSLGGQISMLYATREHARTHVDGLVLVASGTAHFRAYPGLRRAGVLLFSQSAATLASVWGYWPGHRLGFGGRQPAMLMRDWARLARTGRFSPADADVDYEALLRETRLPVLAVSVAGDTQYSPRSAVDGLVRKLPPGVATRMHWRPSDGSRPGHLRWPRSADELATRIAEWTTELRAARPQRTPVPRQGPTAPPPTRVRPAQLRPAQLRPAQAELPGPARTPRTPAAES